MFSAVISKHLSKNRMIISILAAEIWYLKKCTVFIGPPCIMYVVNFCQGGRIIASVCVLLSVSGS